MTLVHKGLCILCLLSLLFAGCTKAPLVVAGHESVHVLPHSKDGTRGWVKPFWHLLSDGEVNAGGVTSNQCGHVWTATEGQLPVKALWLTESRGVQFNTDPDGPEGESLLPRNLQWDSTGKFLYYEFGGGPIASGVWRVEPGKAAPRYVSATREAFRLLPQPDGSDHVICSQVRDGEWLWYAYTPEDIAREKHAFSTNQVFTDEDKTIVR